MSALRARPGRRYPVLAAGAAVALLAAVSGWVVGARPVSAAPSTTLYVATSTNGGDDTNACTKAAPCATIGQAIGQAVAGDTIMVGAGTFAPPGQLNIDKDLTITGSAGGTTVRVPSSLLFAVNGSPKVRLDRLTLAGPDGGSIAVGIYGGSVTIADSTLSNAGPYNFDGTLAITGSSVTGRDGVYSPGPGGTTITGSSVTGSTGVANHEGPLTISDSTIAGSSEGVFSVGTRATITTSTITGGIFNGASPATITASTVVGNGEFTVQNEGTLSILGSTLVGDGGSGLSNYGTLAVAGSIVTASKAGNCGGGDVTDGGYNLSSDDSCAFSARGSRNSVDPMLGPVGNHGGPTESMIPASGSPATNAIPAKAVTGGKSLCRGTSDQRGVRRPQGSACDIGAVERSVVTVTASDASMVAGGPRPSVRPTYSGFIDGDTAADLNRRPTCTANVRARTTTCSGGKDDLYDFAYRPGTLTVHPPLAVDTTSLPDGTVGTPYRATLSASGGNGQPYVWSLAKGSSLPDGLSLSGDGVISGTPSEAGTVEFTVTVNDPASKALTMTISPAPAPASTPPPSSVSSAPSGSAPSAPPPTTTPGPPLAQTGFDARPIVLGGIALLLAGVLMLGLGVVRRRADGR